MVAKVLFLLSLFLGAVFALGVGINTSWSNDLWALPLIVGVLVGAVTGLVARRVKDIRPIATKITPELRRKILFRASVPIVLGGFYATALGVIFNWSKFSLVIVFLMSVQVSMALILSALQIEGHWPRLSRWDAEKQERQKAIVEIILFFGLLAGIAIPFSAKRGILIGEYQVTTRSLFVAYEMLLGIKLLGRLVRYGRKLKSTPRK